MSPTPRRRQLSRTWLSSRSLKLCNVSSVTAEHGVFDMRSAGMWYGYTMTSSSEYRRRNAQGDSTAPRESKNVCKHKAEIRPLRAKRKCQSLDLKKYSCDNDKRCRKTHVLCVVWVFSPPARMSACSGSSESLKLCSKSIVYCQSTATTYSTMNSSTNHPIETTTKKMGVLVALPAWEIPGVLLYQQIDVRALLNVQLSGMYLLT